MKTDSRQHLNWGARGLLLARLLGVTGLFVAVVGAFILGSRMTDWNTQVVADALDKKLDQVAFVGACALLLGLVLVALLLVVELGVALFGSGRKSAATFSATLQVVLAIAAVGGIGYLAYRYPKHWDMTREKTFTLPNTVASKQRELSGGTTIVVFQQHNAFGQLSKKRDIYEFAAERKITQKVRDEVEKFRQLGPKFRIIELDTEDNNYEDKLDEATATRPGLKDAIAGAPENSIFVYADDLVQEMPKADAEALVARAGDRKPPTSAKDDKTTRVYTGQNIPRLSFNEYYLLDKTSSMQDNPFDETKPRRNLFLQRQGVDALARRVLAIQEKKPKVALLAIHEWLTTKTEDGGQEQFTAFGMRKSLESYGFEVVDVVLKRFDGREPSPAAYTLEETELNRLETELESASTEIRTLKESRDELETIYKLVSELSLAELNKRFRRQAGREITEEVRQDQLKKIRKDLADNEDDTKSAIEENTEADAAIKVLLKKERSFEDRRITDVQTKLQRTIADCDLLIIPRHTIINSSSTQAINASLYRMSPEQIDVVKSFMKAGKPVLACFGPNSDPSAPPTVQPPPIDDMESLLFDRGIELGRQTVMYDVEKKAFAAREAGNTLGVSVNLPPVVFDTDASKKKVNPIADAMATTTRSTGQSLDIRLRNPRLMYVTPEVAAKLPFAAEFMKTDSKSFNEVYPFQPERNGPGGLRILGQRPRYTPTKFDDPLFGTHDAERRGPFTIGVAIDAPCPVTWYEPSFAADAAFAAAANPFDMGLSAACMTAVATTKTTSKTLDRKSSRLVVIGHGGWFLGKQMDPAPEQLLLHTCNWLLRRDERLPRIGEEAAELAQLKDAVPEVQPPSEWKFHRVPMAQGDAQLWRFGTFVLLPGVFLYLGMMVFLVRRVR